jgi:NTP pyrophosphatase (non-canonical NTP hydrolase)
MATPYEYQEWVRTRWAANPREQDLAIMSMGLAGEGGEVADEVIGLFRAIGKVEEPVKKLIRGTHDHLDTQKLTLELGDVIHYLTAIANHFDISLNTILEMNMAKLNKRGNNYSTSGKESG